MILSRVIYSGVHCGDFIPTTDVNYLVFELKALATHHNADPEIERFLRSFEEQLRELVTASLRTGKPLVF